MNQIFTSGLLLLILGSMTSLVRADPAVLIVTDDTSHINITRATEFLVDPQARFDPQAVVRGDLNEMFKPWDQSGRLPTNGAWFRFRLTCDCASSQTLVLPFDTVQIRSATLYGKSLDVAMTRLATSQDDKRQLSQVALTFTMQPWSVNDYYLHVDAVLPQYELQMQKPESYLQSIIATTKSAHLFYGASAGIFLYSLMFLVSTRDRNYLWFCTCILSYSLAWATRDGSAFVFWPSFISTHYQPHSTWIFLTLSYIFFTRLFVVFLNLKERMPMATTVFNTFIGFWLACLPLILTLEPEDYELALPATSWLFGSIHALVLLKLCIQRYRDAWIYAIAYVYSLASHVAVSLLTLGIIAPNAISEQTALLLGPQLGQLFWMVVMTYALGSRIRQLSDEQEAATSESRSKSTFLATMSHEIRTPMNGVLGMAELLSGTRLDQQQKSYVDTIRGSASGLLIILNDILDLSKIQSGKLELEHLPIQLDQLVAEVMSLFAHRARDQSLSFMASISPETPRHIWGDPTRIRQVLVNLLSNAFKFTSTGHILVEVECDDTLVHFRVTDTGIGISAEDQSRVFAAFGQADKSTQRRYGGSGLGLSICRELVSIMGGQIHLNSQPQIGSEFSFSIILDVKDDPNFPLTNCQPSCYAEHFVILIDQDNVERGFLSGMLENAGIEGCLASNPDEVHILVKEAKSRGKKPTLLSDLPLSGLARDPGDAAAMDIPSIRILPPASGTDGTDEQQIILNRPISPAPLRQALMQLWQPEVHLPKPQSHREEEDLTIGQAWHVLVAEDNEVNQRVIKGMLKRLGIEPSIAVNGSEAVQRYIEHEAAGRPFDLILMDCEMPEVDGYEATRQIRAHESELNLPGIEIVALTANVLTEHRQHASDIGMTGYLTKPVRLDDLRSLFSQDKRGD